jgi:branched-chain amino acid transport system permease protein
MQFLEILFGGLTLGAIYCVFGVGLSLVYGTGRVLNFAHGSIYMAGAYLAWVLSVGLLNLSYPYTLLILVPVMFGFGMLIERILIRPLRKHDDWQTKTMLMTLGLAFVIDNANLMMFGSHSKLLPPLVEGTVSILGVTVSMHRVMVFILAVGIVLALELFLRYTRHGQAMRAVAQDQLAANMVGINVHRVFGYTFGISVVLAGLAGVLLAPMYMVSPFGGWEPFLKAFVIVVFGGLGSTRGVLLAAFILGVMEAFVTVWVGSSWIMPIWLLTLLVVLMVRPQGLLGTVGR